MSRLLQSNVSVYSYSRCCIEYVLRSVTEKVTDYVGSISIGSTRAWSVGDTYMGKIRDEKTGKIITREREKSDDTWILSTKEHCKSNDIQSHAEWLLERIEGHSRIYECLRNERVEVLLFFYFKIEEEPNGFSINPELLRKLLSLTKHFEVRNYGKTDPLWKTRRT